MFLTSYIRLELLTISRRIKGISISQDWWL